MRSRRVDPEAARESSAGILVSIFETPYGSEIYDFMALKEEKHFHARAFC